MKKLSFVCVLMILVGCLLIIEVLLELEIIVEFVVEVIEEVFVILLMVVIIFNDVCVCIMNIKFVYEDGIEFNDGKYDIEVIKFGYLIYCKWIVVDKKIILIVDFKSIEFN